MKKTTFALLLIALHAASISQARADEPSPSGSADARTAAQSLSGPWAETGFGIGMTVAALPLWALLDFTLGPPLLECLSLFGDDNDPEQASCESDHAAKQAEAERTALMIAAPVGAVGLALLAHGAYRVAHIRRARARVVSLGHDVTPTFAAGPGQFSLGLRFQLM